MVSYRHLLLDPVFRCDHLWYLRRGERPAVLLQHRDGTPVAGFGGEWKPVLAYTGLAGVDLLAFERLDGSQATWIVSPDGRRLGDRLSDLAPADRAALQRSVRQRGLDEPEGLIADGLQFIEARLRREILGVAPRRAALPPSGAPGSMMFGAPQGLLSYARYPAGHASAGQSGTFTFGPGWSRDSGTVARAIASPCMAGLAVVPAASRHLLSVTLMPVQVPHAVTAERPPDRIRIVANGRCIGVAALDARWQRDGARFAFWLPPGQGPQGPLALEFHHADGFDLAGLDLSLGTTLGARQHTDAELMMLFENIGDNCEFGLVQRHFAAEPVGLLRFAGLGDAYRLIRLLDEGFGNLGEPGSLGTIIVGGEYWIQDRIYGVAYHTFRYQHDSDADSVLRDNEVKTRYLTRKLREDLEDGEKIFVYKRAVTRDPHEVLALHAALNQFGTVNKLLWVTPEDDEHRPGDVEWVSDRLLHGTLRTISLSNANDFDPATWLLLCRNAVAAFGAAAV
ncbi:hypothetical protein [Lichenicoccus sp.]|uniref:hypothetical protein n=1 Tax=Lichenicoccus sp. TaxID=2781899 RepID=UPI003D0BDCA7